MTIRQWIESQPRVDEISDERRQGHGIWVYYKRGTCSGRDPDNRHNDREETWTALRGQVKAAMACNCERCIEAR